MILIDDDMIRINGGCVTFFSNLRVVNIIIRQQMYNFFVDLPAVRPTNCQYARNV